MKNKNANIIAWSLQNRINFINLVRLKTKLECNNSLNRK